MLHVCNYIIIISSFQDAEESQSTIDILAAPLSVYLAEELSEGCEGEKEKEGEETSNAALTHCLFRLINKHLYVS